MDKLAWASLPLFVALGVWAAWRWRVGPWSRPAWNAATSLLLAVYLLATAGLGLFWVANQQLPVFDWHYLFGYLTLLLLGVHLFFNLGSLLRQLRHRLPGRRGGAGTRPAPAPAAASASGRARRRGLALIGLALWSGALYWLGHRQGRREGDLASAGARPGNAGPAATATALALAQVERFHALSALRRQALSATGPAVDWGRMPPPSKLHPGSAQLALPAPLRSGAELAATSRAGGAAGSAAGSAAASAAGGAVESAAAPANPPSPAALSTLSTLLWAGVGVSERRGGLLLRTAPSSGALFPTELYLLLPGRGGWPQGVWHHESVGHRLERLPGPPPALAPPALGLLVASAVLRRSGHKYGDRSWRYLLADLGHVLENLRLAAQALGLQLQLQPAFEEGALARQLGLDEEEEAVLACALVLPAEAPLPPLALAPHWQPARDEGQARLGATARMYRASRLQPRAAEGVSSGLPAPAPLAPAPLAAAPVASRPEPAGETRQLPRQSLPAAPPRDVLALLARRRSQRRFQATPLSLEGLAQLHAAVFEPAPLLSTALRHGLFAQAVEGLAPGSWACSAAAPQLTRRRAQPAGLRAATRTAALGQDVIGDAALVWWIAADRATLAADPLGPARGWRHAFVEAGLAGERLYLAAQRLGLSVCGVGAFFDDEMAALAGLDPAQDWLLHLVALGRPA